MNPEEFPYQLQDEFVLTDGRTLIRRTARSPRPLTAGELMSNHMEPLAWELSGEDPGYDDETRPPGAPGVLAIHTEEGQFVIPTSSIVSVQVVQLGPDGTKITAKRGWPTDAKLN